VCVIHPVHRHNILLVFVYKWHVHWSQYIYSSFNLWIPNVEECFRMYFHKLCSHSSSMKWPMAQRKSWLSQPTEGLIIHWANKLASDLCTALLGTLKSPARKRSGALGIPLQPHCFLTLSNHLSCPHQVLHVAELEQDPGSDGLRNQGLLKRAGKRKIAPAESSQSLHNPEQIKEMSHNPSIGHQHPCAQKRQ